MRAGLLDALRAVPAWAGRACACPAHAGPRGHAPASAGCLVRPGNAELVAMSPLGITHRGRLFRVDAHTGALPDGILFHRNSVAGIRRTYDQSEAVDT